MLSVILKVFMSTNKLCQRHSTIFLTYIITLTNLLITPNKNTHNYTRFCVSLCVCVDSAGFKLRDLSLPCFLL